eukprot:403371515
MFLNLYTVIFSTSWYFIVNGFFLIIYKLNHPLIEKYKVTTELWPWQENYREWRKLLRKSIKQILFNNLALIPVLLFAQRQLFGAENIHPFSIDSLPDSKTLLLQIIFCSLMEDLAFTFTHRIFHTPFFYKRFHKIHHQYTNSVGICAEYCHPVEFVFGNAIPFTIPCLLLGGKMHAYTNMLWGAFRVANTVYGHSGYDFPFIFSELLPFNSTTSYHDYHHSANVGNYSGMFTFWDTIFEWNKDFYKYQSQKENSDIKNIKFTDPAISSSAYQSTQSNSSDSEKENSKIQKKEKDSLKKNIKNEKISKKFKIQ